MLIYKEQLPEDTMDVRLLELCGIRQMRRNNA